MKKLLLILSFTVIGLGISAQQDAMFTHYMFNTIAVNPAYAGSRDAFTITGLHRSQWVGFEGAPITQTLTMHTPIPLKNSGIGLSFVNDKIGPMRTTSFYVDYSYTIQIGKKSHLAFGFKAGANMLKGDLTSLSLTDPNDPAYISDTQSEFLPNFGFGLYYNTDNYYAGISVPKLLENDFKNNSVSGSTDLGGEEKHYFLIAGSIFNIGQQFKIKPTTFVKVTNAAPIEADITATLIYKDKVWLGGMFRTGDAAGMLMGINITDVLAVSYSFDFSYTNSTFKYNQGSHEIMLRYDLVLKNEKKIYSPRYF
ncbi:MAG: type IX secretion system membrane protein PorP/SprF [Bacteroidota bacterium]